MTATPERTRPQPAETGAETGASTPSPTPSPGRPPVAAPAAGYVGTLLALLFLAAGVVALRDSAVSAGWLNGRQWTKSAIGWIDGLGFDWWMIPVGVVLVVIGGWWVYAALRPRRRTAVPVAANSSVWIGSADVARLATQAAESVPGVLEARSSATLRAVTVTARTTTDEGLDAAITTAVRDAIAITDAPLKIRVRTREGSR